MSLIDVHKAVHEMFKPTPAAAYAALAWLGECASRYYANGAELAMTLGGPTIRLSSPCDDTHNFLVWAEMEGLIQRGRNRDLGHLATRNVLFFDVNKTLQGRNSPVLYGFSPTKLLLEYIQSAQEAVRTVKGKR